MFDLRKNEVDCSSLLDMLIKELRVRQEQSYRTDRDEGGEKDRREKKQTKNKQVVVSCSLCLWRKNKEAAAAKHVYKLVYKSKKTAQIGENSQTRPETLNPCRARRYLLFNGSKPLSIAHDTFHSI